MTLSVDPNACLPRRGPAAPPTPLEQALARNVFGRLVQQVIRRPEYGVLYAGIGFWVIAGTLGIGRPIITILAAHV